MDPYMDPIWILDGSLYGSYMDPLYGSHMDPYLDYMDPIWILYGSLYLYDHPAGDKEVGGGERRPEEVSHPEGKHNAEHKMEKHRFCA